MKTILLFKLENSLVAVEFKMGEFRQNLDAILQQENSDQKGDVKKKSEIITPYASTFREGKIVRFVLNLKVYQINVSIYLL